jgi:guanylate cyclase soluble subunit beta
MVVGGIPEIQKDHAQRIANFAVDMVKDACKVKSPATGKPLQVSLGVFWLHISGPCSLSIFY